MKSARLCTMAALASVILVLTLPAIALGGAAAKPAPSPAVDLGSVLSVGFGVSPLGVQLSALPVGVSGQGRDTGPPTALEAEGKALSFDVRLRWPGADGAGPLEPYLSFGPALFLVEPDYAGPLFGAYELTTAADGGLSSGVRAGSDPSAGGYDFTYGIRFRF